MTERKLVCISTGNEFADDGLILEEPGQNSLLRTQYTDESFGVHEDHPGIYKFSDFLPIDRMLEGSAAPVTYRSEGLAKALGLERLYITFSGYWPERGALMRTGSFKECEAYSVCARFPNLGKTLLVASAGNTARAFIRAAGENGIPLVVVVPEQNLPSVWSVSPVPSNVTLIASGQGSDYSDAIALAAKLCAEKGYINEGGAKNVARRDGMGTTVLSAASEIGEIPDAYFQAVGSGTGAIAAHEANLRLNESGTFSPKTMRLMLSQNIPFTPLTDAWTARSRTLAALDNDRAKRDIAAIDATVLSNRTPPYSIAGGLFDVLTASDGHMAAVSNGELREAQAQFLALEGCDICPESGVALASLKQAAGSGLVAKDEIIMLNITGGGYARIEKEFSPEPVLPLSKFQLY